MKVNRSNYRWHAFKKKWLRGGRKCTERLKGIIDRRVEETKRELFQMIGVKVEDTEDDLK